MSVNILAIDGITVPRGFGVIIEAEEDFREIFTDTLEAEKLMMPTRYVAWLTKRNPHSGEYEKLSRVRPGAFVYWKNDYEEVIFQNGVGTVKIKSERKEPLRLSRFFRERFVQGF